MDIPCYGGGLFNVVGSSDVAHTCTSSDDNRVGEIQHHGAIMPGVGNTVPSMISEQPYSNLDEQMQDVTARLDALSIPQRGRPKITKLPVFGPSRPRGRPIKSVVLDLLDRDATVSVNQETVSRERGPSKHKLPVAGSYRLQGRSKKPKVSEDESIGVNQDTGGEARSGHTYNVSVNKETVVRGRSRTRRAGGTVRVSRKRGGRRGGTLGHDNSHFDIECVNESVVDGEDGCTRNEESSDGTGALVEEVYLSVNEETVVRGRSRTRRGGDVVRAPRKRGARRGRTRGRGNIAPGVEHVVGDCLSDNVANDCSPDVVNTSGFDQLDEDVGSRVNADTVLRGRGSDRGVRGGRVTRNRGGRRRGTRRRGGTGQHDGCVNGSNGCGGCGCCNVCAGVQHSEDLFGTADIGVIVGQDLGRGQDRGRRRRARGGRTGNRRGDIGRGNESNRGQRARPSKRRGRGAGGGSRAKRGRGCSTNTGGVNDAPPRHAPGSFGSFLASVKRAYRHDPIDDGYYRLPDSYIENVLEDSIGRMSMVCEWCDAKYFPKEKPKASVYKKCCFEGKVMVPPGKPYPEELKELFLGDTEIGRAFRDNLRLYNNGCAFAAFTHNSVHLKGRGPRTYSVHGRSYHRMGSQNADVGQTPRYNQLYSVDSSVATQLRVDLPYHEACDARVFEIIDKVIRRENPFYDALNNMMEVQRSMDCDGDSGVNNDTGVNDGTAPSSGRVTLFIGNNERRNIRNHAAPTSREEISVLITGDTDDGKPDRYVALYWKGKPIQFIHFANPCLDPLVYPLLFVYGQLGYSISLFSYDANIGAPAGLRPSAEDVINASRALQENERVVIANRQRNRDTRVEDEDDVEEDDRPAEDDVGDGGNVEPESVCSDRSSPESVVSVIMEEPSVMDWSSDNTDVDHDNGADSVESAVPSKRRRLLSVVDDISVEPDSINVDSIDNQGCSTSNKSPGVSSRGRHGVNRRRFLSVVEDVSMDAASDGVNPDAGINEHVLPSTVNPMDEEEVELELDEDNEVTVTRTRDKGKVSQMNFYSHMVHVRVGNEGRNFSPLFHSGKLFQQYICDAFVKMIDERLLFIRRQQGTLRAASYTQVAEQLQKRSVDGNVPVGKMVILPSSFQNSERNMRQHYRDAMQIVTKYGKPDYFVTFTCNPRWEEITSNLFPGQSAVNRPDLVARVFKLKVDAFLKELKEKKILGTVVAYTYTIEFQKRGLPHLHLLIIVDKESKPNTAEKIDTVVSAEIPDPAVHPILYERVATHMIHGPCGSLNVHSACMVDHSCIKQFPKSYAAETLVDQKTFPTYRRRDNGRNPVKIGYHEVNNKWVVPYNPYLLMKYNAHINVEVCSSLKSVKYIYKYVHKGHDRVTAVCSETGTYVDPNAASGVNNASSGEPTPSTSNATPGTIDHDEVQDHIDGRYVCAPEAMGRLLGHTTTHSSHAVYRLPVHLPMEQWMLFTEGLEREAVEREMNKPTPLLGWFELNKIDDFARTLRYSQLAEHYVWNKKSQVNPRISFTWTSRKRKTKVIARMHGVTMDNMELFSLRLLLLHVTGCTSYEDVRTFPEGVVCASFKDAAVKRGLLDDDACWDETMEEAIAFEMPRQLRQLFSALVVHGGVTDPLRLWDKYKEHLIEDYRVLNDEENATNMALRDVSELLRLNGKEMSSYKLPEPGVITDGMYFDREYPVENELENVASRIPLLNVGQKRVLRKILRALKVTTPAFKFPAGFEDADDVETVGSNDRDGKQKLFYIDGPGGTGKTFLYNTLLSIVRSRLYTALAVAPTGIAACLLPGGWTSHSRFGIPLDLDANSTSSIDPSSRKADELRACKIVIWDEISMSHKYALALVDRLLRDITKVNEDFGGKIVVLGGDFRQQLPITPGGGRADAVNACVASSNLWPSFKKLALTENMRTNPEHREFAEWLIQLGNGAIPPVDPLFPNDIEIPDEFLLRKTEGCHSMVDFIFGQSLKPADASVYINKAILCPLNEDTFKVNQEVIERLEGELVTFLSMDVAKPLSGDPFDPVDISTELLNAQTPSGLPPHKLELKVGAVIMLLRNLNPKVGLVNGARMVVTDVKPGAKVIKAKLMTGKFSGESVLIPRIKLCPTDSTSSLPVKLERTQFPIRVAFAMTISKSQGQTLEYVGIVLSKPVFAHGQLYTGMSRSVSKLNVKIQIGPELLGNPCRITSNIVYREIFGLRDT